ncbi:hypothetical protein K0M31_008419, partial [Melipona bicolor]
SSRSRNGDEISINPRGEAGKDARLEENSGRARSCNTVKPIKPGGIVPAAFRGFVANHRLWPHDRVCNASVLRPTRTTCPTEPLSVTRGCESLLHYGPPPEARERDRRFDCLDMS